MMDDMEFYERQEITEIELEEDQTGFETFQGLEDSTIDFDPDDKESYGDVE